MSRWVGEPAPERVGRGAGAEIAPARWPTWLLAVYAASLAGAVGGAMCLDLAADREGRTGMGFLTPAFRLLVENGRTLRRLDVPPTWILPASAVAVLLYVLFAKAAWLRPRLPVAPRGADRRLPFVEVLCLGLLSLAVVAVRFYALNRVPRDFVGELVFQVVCATDWRTLLSVNGGSAPLAPWVPVGLLHYLLTGALWHLSGSTVLTLCFASAVSSVMLLQVLYWFVRLLAGPLAALVAASLYAASPLETVWGRHAMQPFNYPSVLVLLVAAATYFAVTRHRLRDWLLAAFLMALTRHSFGSAYAGFLIPIGAVLWLRLFDRERLRRSGWKPWLLLIGVGLWLLGPALAMSVGAGEWHWVSPMDPRLDSRAFRGAGWSGSLDAVLENVRKVVGPLYVGKRGQTIQTPTVYLGEPRLTFLSPVVMILFPAGVLWMLVHRRRPAVPVLLSLSAAALVPGLISTADPHRQASLYPALCAIAGVAAAEGLGALRRRFATFGKITTVVVPAVVLSVLLARSTALYFTQPMGEAPSVVITRTIQERVSPGTLLVLYLPWPLDGDVAYLLFDDSLVEPFGWMFIDEDKWDDTIRDFRPRFDHLFQRLTVLRHRVPELERTRWKRILFVLHESLDPAPKIDGLREKFGAVTVERVLPRTWRAGPRDVLTFVSVDNVRP